MNWLFIFLKGFAMGAANVIPGVSGGTVAFITGIYERLINAIKSFDIAALRMLKKKRLGDFVRHVDLGFLCVLGLGVVVSVFSLAKFLEWAYETHPVDTSGVFFGLIALSVYSVAKMVKKWGVSCVIAALVGCAIAVSLAFIDQAGENKEYWYLAICGAVAMCSMILPGISGSFVLILMGNYLLILNSVNDLRALKWGAALPVIIPVGIGAVVGVVLLSRFLSWLFKSFHDLTTALITGFVAGSLFVIWPWKNALLAMVAGKEKVIGYERFVPDLSQQSAWLTVAWILAGAALMLVVELLGRGKKSSV